MIPKRMVVSRCYFILNTTTHKVGVCHVFFFEMSCVAVLDTQVMTSLSESSGILPKKVRTFARRSNINFSSTDQHMNDVTNMNESRYACTSTGNSRKSQIFQRTTQPMRLVFPVYICWSKLICVTWPIHMCDVSQPFIFGIRVTWRIHMYDVNLFLSAGISTQMNESWHTYEWVTASIWMSHNIHMYESWHAAECVMQRVWMSHGTHMNESCHTHEWGML